MKKILYFALIISFSIFSVHKASALPNPWSECGNDISCAADVAGFNFPLQVQNCQIRAMKDMIEITFSNTWKRKVTIRKSVFYEGNSDEYGIKDISGDYNDYPINKIIWIEQSVPFRVRGDKNRFYIANFAAETGYYSIICEKGLKFKDIKYFYKLLEEAEAPRCDLNKTNNYTIEQLQDSRRVDGIVEPVYTQDCFPKTLKRKGVTQNCFKRANLGQDIFCSASEIKMIKEYYKKGQGKDPLNNGSGQFCAKE